MTMHRVTRDRRLTADEAAKYNDVRAKVAAELPDIIQRHHARIAADEQLRLLVGKLREERERQGLSVAELTTRAGLAESAIDLLEGDSKPNPTVADLSRYAEAIGKRLVLSLIDA